MKIREMLELKEWTNGKKATAQSRSSVFRARLRVILAPKYYPVASLNKNNPDDFLEEILVPNSILLEQNSDGLQHSRRLKLLMPRKRTPHYAKPVTVSSTSGVNVSQQPAATFANGERSVNDLIQHLRRSQISSKPPERSSHNVNSHTVHPSLNAILDVQETPAPRLRPGIRVRRTRGPAGPPAPVSWAKPRRRTSTTIYNQERAEGATQTMQKSPGTLPGLRLPTERSLLHLAFKSLAKKWESLEEHELLHLATLPVQHKEATLSYIAYYNPQSLSYSSIDLLFHNDPELANTTSCEGLTHLDLDSCLGRGIKVTELKKIFLKEPKAKAVANTASEAADVPESWDSQSVHLSSPMISPRFPFLTHLSLAHPVSPSWRHLLALAPHLATLTHLSLAHWPTPCLTPNSMTAYRETPFGKVDYGASNMYSVSVDRDLNEASSVLRRLSKATYCLKWLDITGCRKWTAALEPISKQIDTPTGEIKDSNYIHTGPDFAGAWRGLETVKAGQPWLPRCLEKEGSEWRQVMEATTRDPKEAHSMEAIKLELVMWARWENKITDTEQAIRSRLKFEPSTGSKTESRSRPVRFERPWRGWWIEEALKYIAEAGDYVLIPCLIDQPRWDGSIILP